MTRMNSRRRRKIKRTTTTTNKKKKIKMQVIVKINKLILLLNKEANQIICKVKRILKIITEIPVEIIKAKNLFCN